MKTLEEKIKDVWSNICPFIMWTSNDGNQEYHNYTHDVIQREETVKLIKKNLAIALLSPSPYVRRYAELISADLQKSSNEKD